jgi:hypothetical protein
MKKRNESFTSQLGDALSPNQSRRSRASSRWSDSLSRAMANGIARNNPGLGRRSILGSRHPGPNIQQTLLDDQFTRENRKSNRQSIASKANRKDNSNMPNDDYYREQAIRAGALKPQNWRETAARNHASNTSGERWEDSATAQARLREWTEDFRSGRRAPGSTASSRESGSFWIWVVLIVVIAAMVKGCHP